MVYMGTAGAEGLLADRTGVVLLLQETGVLARIHPVLEFALHIGLTRSADPPSGSGGNPACLAPEVTVRAVESTATSILQPLLKGHRSAGLVLALSNVLAVSADFLTALGKIHRVF